MDDFRDLDAAFWSLREANPEPVPVPGPDAARGTVRRRRTRAKLLASAAALVLFVGAVVGVHVLENRSATISIAPAGPAEPRWWPDPLPSGSPDQLAELGLEGVRQELVNPTGSAGCPAATLHFDGDFSDQVGKVRYWVSTKSVAYGDLTGDGHDELAVVLSCQVNGGATKEELLVMTAVDTYHSRTLAAGHVVGNVSVEGMAILRGTIVLYSHPTIQNPATEDGRYVLIGDGKIAAQGPSVTPTP